MCSAARDKVTCCHWFAGTVTQTPDNPVLFVSPLTTIDYPPAVPPFSQKLTFM